MRMVVTRLPKKEGPPKSARQPRRFFSGVAGFPPLADLFLGFFGDTVAINGIILSYMTLVEYKKAFLKYAPLESFAAGLELMGQEVKALRSKQGSLDGLARRGARRRGVHRRHDHPAVPGREYAEEL